MILSVLTALSCGNKKTKLVNLINDPENGLLQVNKTGSKKIIIQLLPAVETMAGETAATTGFYKLKLVLQGNEKIKDKSVMAYMNFGIRHILYATQGLDTLPCSICERVPGINANEYVYIAIFNKPGKAGTDNTDLRLCVADTIAGFGITTFQIKAAALRKLEKIN